MAITISFINNKGGVAKTTSTAVIAELLAALGSKVLVIDLDEQSNLSMYFHQYREDSEEVISGLRAPKEKNICELFKYRYRSADDVCNLIRHTNIQGIDIIPSSKRHTRTVLELTLNTGNNNIVLKRALKSIKDNYDYILIDNAPASNILTVNSMFASDYITTPVKIEQYSLKGLKETLTSILYIKEEHDLDSLSFLGAFLTQVNLQTKAFKSAKKEFDAQLQEKIFRTVIREDKKVNESNQELTSLILRESRALNDYAALILEMRILPESKAKKLKTLLAN